MKIEIEITKTKKTGTIKQIFNKAFPYLKIEFFNKAHSTGEPSSRNQLVQNNVNIGEINANMKEGLLSIDKSDKVSAFEQLFQQKFGLSVQVFRKQNNVWIETTKTDQLTLGEQNEKGKVASAPTSPSAPADRYLEDGQY